MLENIYTYAQIIRLMRKGLNIPQISKVLNFPQEKVRKLVNSGMRFDRAACQREIERQSEIDEMEDYVKGDHPWLDSRGQIVKENAEVKKKRVNLMIVKNMKRQGLTDAMIAGKLKLDVKDFARFMRKNKKYLTVIS